MWCDSLPILHSRASQETCESRYIRLKTVSSFSLEVYTFIREQEQFKFRGVKLKPLKGCLIQSKREKETFDNNICKIICCLIKSWGLSCTGVSERVFVKFGSRLLALTWDCLKQKLFVFRSKVIHSNKILISILLACASYGERCEGMWNCVAHYSRIPEKDLSHVQVSSSRRISWLRRAIVTHLYRVC